jgi:hypothetical protein
VTRAVWTRSGHFPNNGLTDGAKVLPAHLIVQIEFYRLGQVVQGFLLRLAKAGDVGIEALRNEQFEVMDALLVAGGRFRPATIIKIAEAFQQTQSFGSREQVGSEA